MNPFKWFREQFHRAPSLAELRVLKFEPGHKAPVSGQYTDNHGKQVTMVRGRRLPPGPEGRNTWYRLTDHTRKASS